MVRYIGIGQIWGNPLGRTDTGSSCGVSLIHADILLSAAHCSKNIMSNVNVVVGALYLRSNRQGILRTVTDRRVHPNFNNKTLTYDFLVLKLNRGVPTPSVPLNSNPNSPISNEQLTVTGLGLTTDGGEEPEDLQKVDVYYLTPSTCSSAYASQGIPNSSTVQMCAGVSGVDKGFCNGDSGGPLLNSRGVQVGIVSGSIGCGSYPGFYSRVSNQISWIQQQVCALSSYPPLYCYKKPLAPTTVWVIVWYDNNYLYSSTNFFNSSQFIVSGDTGSSESLFTVTTLSLTPGYYYMQLINTLGTGICCSDGIGFYGALALVNGYPTPIIPSTYGYFSGSYVNASLIVPKASTAPVKGSASGTTVRIPVFFDDYPSETGFVITNAAGKYVASSEVFVPPSYAGLLVEYTFVLKPGTYTFTITDSYGDGICCGHGIGYFGFYALVNGSYQQLFALTYGTFTYFSTRTFTVPSSLSAAAGADAPFDQSPMPPLHELAVCQDAPIKFSYRHSFANGTYVADEQTCQWLGKSSNSAWKAILCKPKEQAYQYCPKTCGACKA